MIDVEKAREDFRRDNKKHMKALGEALGMDEATMNLMNEKFGDGISSGEASYTPVKGRSYFGIFEYQIEERGKKVPVRKEITNKAEAGFLSGLQLPVGR